MNQDNINSSEPSDLKNQQDLDNALIDAGLPQNKLNGLVAMISDKLICDSACQAQRNGDSLKKKWDLAQNNLKLAPERVDIAEKNYYVYTVGEQGYLDIIYQRNLNIAQQFKTGQINDYQTNFGDLTALLTTYNTDKDYDTRLTELLNIRTEEKKELEFKIDQYLAKVQTSGRKVVY